MFSRIAKDKLLHFFAGAGIMTIAYPFFSILAIIIVVIVAVAKEGWDYYDDETTKDVEMWDLLATVLGGIVCYGLFILLGGWR